MKRICSLVLMAGLVVSLVGCEPIERTAYNTVVAAKAGLVEFRLRHTECAPYDPVTGLAPAQFTALPCVANNRLTAAKDLLIDAAELYCASPAFETGAACVPPAQGTPARQLVTDRLDAALRNYEQIAADFRGVFP